MNIVFAFADDWGKYASIYNENPLNCLVQTPNIDRIANEGVLFKNAVVPAPSCTPCRSSVLSGKYFWQTGLGAILMGAQWDSSIPTYPLELEKNGYHIGYTYKVWSPGSPVDEPYGGSRNSYMKHGNNFNNFSHYVTEKSSELSISDAKEILFSEVRNNFLSFLNHRKENQNFCYWWGPTNTHRTWERGSGKNLWDIEPDDLKGILPKCLPDVHEVREDFADYLGEVLAFDAGIGILIDELEKINELDNTLFVVSGDHGIPGMPRGKCNLYNLGCDVALMARYPATIKSGRIVDDVVNLMDLAPTFLDMANVNIPNSMNAKSLKTLLVSQKNGQIEEERTFAVMGRERHVDSTREGFLPYPQRSIRTKEFLYIINFEPDRWPVGEPGKLEDPEHTIPYDILVNDTRYVFGDFDASPTKAWMIYNRNEKDYKSLYNLAIGKRPYEELYDLSNDADTIVNVADNIEYKQIKAKLNFDLMTILENESDPRLTKPCIYESLPYTSVMEISRKYRK